MTNTDHQDVVYVQNPNMVWLRSTPILKSSAIASLPSPNPSEEDIPLESLSQLRRLEASNSTPSFSMSSEASEIPQPGGVQLNKMSKRLMNDPPALRVAKKSVVSTGGSPHAAPTGEIPVTASAHGPIRDAHPEASSGMSSSSPCGVFHLQRAPVAPMQIALPAVSSNLQSGSMSSTAITPSNTVDPYSDLNPARAVVKQGPYSMLRQRRSTTEPTPYLAPSGSTQAAVPLNADLRSLGQQTTTGLDAFASRWLQTGSALQPRSNSHTTPPAFSTIVPLMNPPAPPFDYWQAVLQGRKEIGVYLQNRALPKALLVYLTILDEAIHRRDQIFLFCCQIRCLIAHPCPQFDDSMVKSQLMNVQPTMNMLHQILGDVSQFPTDVLNLLSVLPVTLATLNKRSPDQYWYLVRSLHPLFEVAHKKLKPFMQTCWDARMGPAAGDIHDHLGVRSPIIRLAIFEVIARKIFRDPSNPARSDAALKRALTIQRLDDDNFTASLSTGTYHQNRIYPGLSGMRREFAALLQWFMSGGIGHLSPDYTGVSSPGAQHASTAMANAMPPVTNITFTEPLTMGNSGPRGPLVPMLPIPPLQGNFAGNGMNLAMSMPMVQKPAHPKSSLRGSLYPSSNARPSLPAQRQDHWALHQSHLRSPLLHAQSLPDDPLYQIITGFMQPPVFMQPHEIIQRFSFDVDSVAFGRLPAESAAIECGAPPVREVKSGTLIVRVKLVKSTSPGTGKMAPVSWVNMECNFPPFALIEVNGKVLELRRKVHYSKDLPIDISGLDSNGERYLREGRNEFKVMFITDHSDDTIVLYAIAIETITVFTERSIKEVIYKSTRPVQETLDKIAMRAGWLKDAGSALVKDSNADDLEIVADKFAITLFEPFSNSRIFDIPVRSATCTHIDCFDLDVFLQARPRKSPGYPSTIDGWRCPICRADARPQKLVIDGFLTEVRKQLEINGLLDTRQIVVDAKGNWEVKKESEASKERSRGPVGADAKHGGGGDKSTASARSVEVIELLDDD